MIDNHLQPGRIVLAQLMGEARHHARWRELTGAGHAAAVAGLRELAAGRADLLAEVAGILEGFHEGELHEPLARQAAQMCRDAGADPVQIPAWIDVGRQRAAQARQPPPSGGLRRPLGIGRGGYLAPTERQRVLQGQAVFAGGDELVYERCFVFLHAVFEQDRQAG